MQPSRATPPASAPFNISGAVIPSVDPSQQLAVSEVKRLFNDFSSLFFSISEFFF